MRSEYNRSVAPSALVIRWGVGGPSYQVGIQAAHEVCQRIFFWNAFKDFSMFANGRMSECRLTPDDEVNLSPIKLLSSQFHQGADATFVITVFPWVAIMLDQRYLYHCFVFRS